MKEIFVAFQKSLRRFEEILAKEKTPEYRDAAIQRFEFVIELAWKSLQKFFQEEKIICRSPKECLREAFKMGMVDDDATWITMLDDRNLTVHTYDEKFADEIYTRLPKYLEILQNLYKKIEEKQEN